MRSVAIIPARYGSVRLPGKPLLNRTGRYLIQHVYEQARAAPELSQVIVATDDVRILEAVQSFGGQAVMTKATHRSGTDRVAEVVAGLDPPPEVVINLQGDEPAFPPENLSRLHRLMMEHPEVDMATLATPGEGRKQWESPHCVKVVRDDRGDALYFSRSPLPFARDGSVPPFLHHLGVYAFRRERLAQLVALPPGELEQIEALEQLRALQAGIRIRVEVVPPVPGGVDTEAEYEDFVAWWRARHGGVNG